MASLTLATLQRIAPSLAADPRAEDFLAMAESEHTAARWGTVYAEAMALYTAHMLTVFPVEALGSTVDAAGPVASRSAGDVSETYAAPMIAGSPRDADLRRTIYGLKYIRLRDSRGYGARVIA